MAPFFREKPDEDKSSPSLKHCMKREQVTGSGSFVPGGEGGDGGKSRPFSSLPRGEANGRRCQAASLSYSPWSCIDTTGMGPSRQS